MYGSLWHWVSHIHGLQAIYDFWHIPCLTKELRSLEWQLPMPPHFRGRRSALGDPQSSPRVPGDQSSWLWMIWRYPNRNPPGKTHGPLINPKVLMLPGNGQTPQELALLFFSPCRGSWVARNGTCRSNATPAGAIPTARQSMVAIPVQYPARTTRHFAQIRGVDWVDLSLRYVTSHKWRRLYIYIYTSIIYIYNI